MAMELSVPITGVVPGPPAFLIGPGGQRYSAGEDHVASASKILTSGGKVQAVVRDKGDSGQLIRPPAVVSVERLP